MVEVFHPKTLDEALAIMQARRCIPMAGGTDLMVKRKTWAGLPPQFDRPVMLTGGIKALQGIEADDKTLRIGAAVTLAAVLEHPLTPRILKCAIREMASPSIRNAGTLGGNLCNASPAGDTLPPLYALNARVRLQSITGMRETGIEAFITGPGKTLLQDDELLTDIMIPIEKAPAEYYRKLGTRKANALSKVSIAGLVFMQNGRAEDIRIALGAVGPTVVRVPAAEDMMRKRPVSEIQNILPKALAAYAQHITPIDDQRSTAGYRKTVSLRLIEDFIRACAQSGEGE